MVKTHRFIGKFDLSVGSLELTDKDLVHQIREVLKLRSGEKIGLCDGNNTEALAEIVLLGKNSVQVNIFEVGQNKNEPEVKVILYCSILKNENFEFVVQKATEVGVSEIVPLITSRTVKTGLRIERLEKIIREAAELSGRGTVPVLREAATLQSTLDSVDKNAANIFFDISGVTLAELEVKATHPRSIWIGPEGGWAEKEVEAAKNAGLTVSSLGKLTLRAETAAIISTYLAIRTK